MTDSRLYLDVPFAQKDQAKALGARWDARRKKWYIPDGIDSVPFRRWSPEPMGSDDSLPGTPVTRNGKSSSAKSAGKASKHLADAKGTMTIAHTQPLDRNFVAYCGEDPPWE